MTFHFSKQVRPKLSATKKCLNLFDLLSPGRQHVWHHKLGMNNFACSEVSWVYSKLSGTWSFERSSMFTTCWERCKAQCHRGTETAAKHSKYQMHSDNYLLVPWMLMLHHQRQLYHHLNLLQTGSPPDLWGGHCQTAPQASSRSGWKHESLVAMLLMEEILRQLIGLSHYSQSFIHPSWCRISSIKSIFQKRPIRPFSLQLCFASSALILSSFQLHSSHWLSRFHGLEISKTTWLSCTIFGLPPKLHSLHGCLFFFVKKQCTTTKTEEQWRTYKDI